MLSLPYSLPLPHTHTLLSPLSLLLFRSSLLSSHLFPPVGRYTRTTTADPRETSQPPLSNPLVNARRQHSRQRSDPLGERGCRDVCVVGVCMCVCVPLGVCVGGSDGAVMRHKLPLGAIVPRPRQENMLFWGFIVGLFACLLTHTSSPPPTQQPYRCAHGGGQDQTRDTQRWQRWTAALQHVCESRAVLARLAKFF